MPKQYDPTRRFQTIADAARTTGLSQFFIRKACREGVCPYIKSGSKFLINVPMLVQQLNEQSTAMAKEIR